MTIAAPRHRAARPAAVSRADLAWAFGEQGEDGLAAMASLLGFEEERPEPQRSEPRPRRGGIRLLDPPIPDPDRFRPVPFWRLEEVKHLEPEEEPPLEGLAPLTAADVGPLAAPASFPPAALTPWPRLHTALYGALRTSREGRQVDVPRLVEKWSRAELAGRLPRRPASAWSPRITLLLDRGHRLAPVRDDQTELALRLLRTSGEAALSLHLRLAESPDLWTDDRTRGRRETPAVEPGEVVLALSDLGLAAREPAELAFWEQLGRRLRAAGAIPWALVPLPASRWPRQLRPTWNRIDWSHPSGAARGRSGAVEAEVLGSRREHLLALVALAVRIEPGLVRELRRLLKQAADVGTELDAWAEVSAESHSFVAASLGSDQSRHLRGLWARLPEAERAGALVSLRRWHGSLAREIWFEELLAAEALRALPPGFEADLAEARRFALRLGATHRSTGPVDGALLDASKDWLVRFGGRVPASLWQDRELGPALGPVLAEALRERGADAVPAGFSLRWLKPEGAPRRWVAWQVGHRVWMRKEGDLVTLADSGAPLGTFLASAPEVGLAPDVLSQAEWIRLSESPPVRALYPGPVILKTDRQELHFARYEREPWANAGTGRDKFGLWAAFEVEGVKHRFRWIPPGRFRMGSPESEQGRWDDEGPRHLVALREGFWLGEAPVAQALWQAVMGKNPSKFPLADRPVEQVSWDECKGFLEKLEEKAPGLGARLPWEAEWEYACRAGTETSTYAGELEIQDGKAELLDSIAWYWANSNEKTQPVRAKPANPWGLYDMLGNVWEWCEDEGAGYSPETITNPFVPPSEGSRRVLRGGSWDRDAGGVRAAARDWGSPEGRSDVVGFRLARGQGAQPEGGAPGPTEAPRGRGAAAPGEGRAGAAARRPRGGAKGARRG